MMPTVHLVTLKDGSTMRVCEARETAQCIYKLEDQIRVAKEEAASWKLHALGPSSQ
jgi:hypothetical protein